LNEKFILQNSEASSTTTETEEVKEKGDETPDFVYKNLSFEEMSGVNFTMNLF
jgi:hypothetical protein